METGAQEMRRSAALLRQREYRERQIAKAAARGHVVTHEQLIDAAEGLENGARDLAASARDLRRSAAEMRRGSH
jgi:hypothetical protein